MLAGGAARGAYEVGVIQHLVEEVSRDLGRHVHLPILCGTSVGAINACAMAAFADEPVRRMQLMVRYWTQLRVEDILLPTPSDFVGIMRLALGFGRRVPTSATPSGLFDAAGLSHLLSEAIPFARIGEHLASGLLDAVTVSTTQVSSGRTRVFVQRRPGEPLRWRSDPTIVAQDVTLLPEHALASAAIPFFFPPVRIGNDYYCDGGLRQNVPFSPARKLGANRMIIIDPRHLATTPDPVAEAADKPPPAPADLALFSKILDAVLLDHLDNDLERITRINSILEAGTRIAGPEFIERLNRELGHAPGTGLRPLRTVLVRSSRDIGALATEFARTHGFRLRLKGLVGRSLSRMAESDAKTESDLLSYLLFDGNFARQLIELGRADARAMHNELCAFFDAANAPDEIEAA